MNFIYYLELFVVFISPQIIYLYIKKYLGKSSQPP